MAAILSLVPWLYACAALSVKLNWFLYCFASCSSASVALEIAALKSSMAASSFFFASICCLPSSLSLCSSQPSVL